MAGPTQAEHEAPTPSAQLIKGIVALAEQWGDVDVADSEDGLHLSLTPAPGLRTFLTVERQPDALFAGLGKIECSTLVGAVTAHDDQLVDFLDTANATTFGGAWEEFSNGDVGVTGQFLLADLTAPGLAELVGQLLALQVDDAIAVGRPPGVAGYEDLHPPTQPPVRLVFHRAPDLTRVTAALRWRSAHHESHRWIVESVQDDEATLLAPVLLTDPVYSNDGEPLADLRRVTIAHTTHPRRGPGVLLQVALSADAQEDAIAYRNWGIATQTARWYGTGLGGLMLWNGDGTTELVYRAFLPLDLLGVLDDDDAVDLVVDAALGAVNITGVAEAIIDAVADPDDVEQIPQAVRERQAELRRHYRVAVLRAATHVRTRDDGLADTDGPLVDVGQAVLDRLALDQLQIATAPLVVGDRSFAWLPGPHVQRVTAGPMGASRGHEITEVSVTTDLGEPAASDRERVRRACVELMATLPLCSLIVGDDGQVQITSTVMVHEGVWWHRAELVAVMAALQLNCAETVRAALELEGIALETGTPLRDRLAEQGPFEGFDPIYDVVPDLRAFAANPDESIADLIGIAEARLLERPFSQLFGDLDDEPNVLVVLHDSDHDGGWDPPLGQALVALEPIDHEVAGESLKVRVNPGFPPGGSDLVAEALRLTVFTHATGGVAVCPSWEITGSTVSATIVIPRIAIASPGLDAGAEIAIQAVDSCLCALARAVIGGPDSFGGFDRSQVNLTRAQPVGGGGHTDAATAAWAPLPNLRMLAFLQQGHNPEHWQDIELSHEAADAFRRWMTAADNMLFFEHPGTVLTAERRASELVLHLQGRDLVVDEETARAMHDQLEHPEGPATGRAPGRVIAYPIGEWAGDDGHTGVVLPPADAVTAVIGAGDAVCEGVQAITSTSLWLHFRSGAGEFDLDVDADLARQMLSGTTEDGTITIVAHFPPVDERVAAPPPGPWVGELSAAGITAALAEIDGIGRDVTSTGR